MRLRGLVARPLRVGSEQRRAKLNTSCRRRRTPGAQSFAEEQGDGNKSAHAGGGWCVLLHAVGQRHGSCPKIGGRPQGLFLRQPGPQADPRGGNDRRRGPDDGGLQQPRDVQTGRAAERVPVDRARSRHRLVVGRGQDTADVSAPRRSEVARRQTLHGEGCRVHLGSADRPVEREAAHQPPQTWYRNFEEVVPNGDSEITFRLKRPQPSFIVLLASGFTPIYPCHVSPRDMRSHPIGTGPFKFVEFKPNEVIRVTRNPDYWKKGRPYLDGIEYTIIRNPSTGILAFVAGKVDITSPFFLQVPLLKDAKRQDPEATCALVPSNVNRNVMMNREAVPFDKPELRRAVALTVDRKAFVDTLTEGKGDFGGAMLPPPEGVWGMPADMLKTLPGYNPDVPKNRAEARGIMEKLGYGPDKRLKLTVSTRNIPPYRDPAVILIDQLKEIYIDGELDAIDTAQSLPRVMRGDYTIALNLTGNGLDDPDQTLYENFTCGAEGNYDRYCSPELDKMVDRQSMEFDPVKRKDLVWAIERKRAEEAARPILWHNRSGTCWHPYVKGYTPMVNSIYNGLRMEDVWLDR